MRTPAHQRDVTKQPTCPRIYIQAAVLGPVITSSLRCLRPVLPSEVQALIVRLSEDKY